MQKFNGGDKGWKMGRDEEDKEMEQKRIEEGQKRGIGYGERWRQKARERVMYIHRERDAVRERGSKREREREMQ